MRNESKGLRVYLPGKRRASRWAGKGNLVAGAGEWIRIELASGGCWYGHGFAHRQPWPLNREAVLNERFAVNNAQSPVWMCSAGHVVMADTVQPLSVRINAGGRGWLEIMCPDQPLVLRRFDGPDLVQAHRRWLAHMRWPPAVPAKRLFGDSIFCTWTQYPRCITQARVLDMARAIRRHGFPCSVLTLDDRWESAFGELTFSRDFPDPAGMVRRLHRMGFEAWLWVTPFINREAGTFRDLAARRRLVMRRDGAGPALLTWWGGTAGLVDLTNPDGRAWYRGQLLRLKADYGVDGFKIDGGDAKYQPDPAVAAWHRDPGPSGYIDGLLELFDELVPNRCESRTVWLSPHRRVLWREGGKDSHWGIDNGLKAMVTLGLHMALLGYDRLIPDMVPGRVQTLVSAMPLPTDELFVRWTEVSALMPLLQFSYGPWNYAPATAAIARGYALLHKALEGALYAAAVAGKAPLIRPLWYDDPGNAALYTIDDAFSLGPDLLVAPVLSERQVARDVVFPRGAWVDAWTGRPIRSSHLFQHPAPCPGMPLFVRASNRSLWRKIHGVLKAIPRGSIKPGVTTATHACGLDRDIKITG